jgi:hypothetical protein
MVERYAAHRRNFASIINFSSVIFVPYYLLAGYYILFGSGNIVARLRA